MIRWHKSAHLATPSRSIPVASRTSREWDLGGSVSQYRRHAESSERQNAYRVGDETGGRLQPIPKVGWKGVQFAGGVGIPSARSPPPFGFGIITRRTGSGRYLFETSSSRKPASHASKPAASICAKVIPSTPAAPAFSRASS